MSHTAVSEAQEVSVRARGLALSGLAFGDSSKPVMLALHGWLDNAATFAPLASHLARHYHLIALDLPGHGRSAWRPPEASYFHADYALDVAHAADALKLDTFALLGHSMGGGIATLVASALPGRVSRLILLDGLGPYSDAAQNTSKQLRRAVTQSLATARPRREYDALEALLERRAQASHEIDREALRGIVQRNAECVESLPAAPRWRWTTDPRLKLASPTRLTHEAVKAVLTDIQAPILNLMASGGMMSQVLEIPRRLKYMTNIRNITIEGHHHFHLDGAVKESAEAILTFLGDVEPFGTLDAD